MGSPPTARLRRTTANARLVRLRYTSEELACDSLSDRWASNDGGRARRRLTPSRGCRGVGLPVALRSAEPRSASWNAQATTTGAHREAPAEPAFDLSGARRSHEREKVVYCLFPVPTARIRGSKGMRAAGGLPPAWPPLASGLGTPARLGVRRSSFRCFTLKRRARPCPSDPRAVLSGDGAR